jgi:hypothetical protein
MEYIPAKNEHYSGNDKFFLFPTRSNYFFLID